MKTEGRVNTKVKKNAPAPRPSKEARGDDRHVPQDPFGDFFDHYEERLAVDSFLNERQKQRIELVNETRNSGGYIFQQPFESVSGPLIDLQGSTYTLLSSYDYLGLIGHKRIERSAMRAIREFGTSCGGVRLLTGTNTLHLKLEKELAAYIGAESALTYSSGYHANLAVLSSVMNSNDVALIDSKIHQSTLDACKLAGLPYRRFEHNNPSSLEKLLKRSQHHAGRVLVISEGMFSMDGDVCKLDEIVQLKNKYGAFLMIDEAHSFGVLGENGSGVASYYNIAPREIDIFTGSLSKAVPASGGFVAGAQQLMIFLQHASSPYIFSASLAPAAAAAARMALKVLKTEPSRHERLWANTLFLRSGLQKCGYNTGLSSTPIIPVILGSDESTLTFSRKLFDRGILATPVLFPAVPKGESRLRLCVTAAHDSELLEEVLETFRELR